MGNPFPGWPSDDNGCFEITGMKSGDRTLNVRLSDDPKKPYVGQGPKTVFVKAGETSEVVMEVEEGTPVSGRIVDKKTGNAPSGQVNVILIKEQQQYEITVDKDCTWKTWLPAGTFNVYVSLDGVNCEPVKLTVEKGKPQENVALEVKVKQ